MTKIFYDYEQNIVEKPQWEPVFWRPGAYGVLSNDLGQICLVLPKSKRFMELPGGGMEHDETIAETLKREMFEETWFYVDIVTQNPLYVAENFFFGNKSKMFFHAFYFVYGCEISKSDSEVQYQQNEWMAEIEKVIWVNIDDIREDNTHPNSYRVLRDIFQLPS